jgi:heme/copper-type cytochrome/quinol oxidase subunit 4
MKPRLSPGNLKHVKAWEYAVRFVFGGVITVITGLLAKYIGPAFAGMFLAFPAILPASLTLVKQHDGRQKASDDARGARLGSIGLVAFAIVVALTATPWPAAGVLAAATAAWLAVSLVMFAIVYGPRSE